MTDDSAFSLEEMRRPEASLGARFSSETRARPLTFGSEKVPNVPPRRAEGDPRVATVPRGSLC